MFGCLRFDEGYMRTFIYTWYTSVYQYDLICIIGTDDVHDVMGQACERTPSEDIKKETKMFGCTSVWTRLHPYVYNSVYEHNFVPLLICIMYVRCA